MGENRETKVKVMNLTKKFDDLLVLDDISFDVKKGEFLCIVEAGIHRKERTWQDHIFKQSHKAVQADGGGDSD